MALSRLYYLLTRVYKNRIEKVVSNYTRYEIQKKYVKEYSYLFTYHREWLLDQLKKTKKPDKSKKYSYEVDWDKRDEEIKEKIQIEYENILKEEKLVRITKSLVCRRIGVLSMFNDNREKLPKTSELINKTTETIEEFHKRRILKVLQKMKKEDKILTVNEFKKESGVGYKFMQKNRQFIEERIGEIVKNDFWVCKHLNEK